MDNNYLIHYKKGAEKDNHKYSSRKLVNGAWVYEYETEGLINLDKKIKEIDNEIERLDDYTNSINTAIKIYSGYLNDDKINSTIKKEYEKEIETCKKDLNDVYDKIKALQNEKKKYTDKKNTQIADNNYISISHSEINNKTGGHKEMDDNDKKYYYLAHGEKGSEWSNHLYTARKWVNGKWQYIYGNVSNAAKQTASKLNNALGADERERRDEAYSKYGAKALNAQKTENKLRNINTNNGYRGQESAIKLAANNRNTANRYKQAYDKAQSDYDKTVYGTVDKAKKAASEAGTNIVKGARRAKDIVSEYGKKTLASLGEAKDKAVARGKDILNNLLKKRKKG